MVRKIRGLAIERIKKGLCGFPGKPLKMSLHLGEEREQCATAGNSPQIHNNAD
jgi:hypothetical protein